MKVNSTKRKTFSPLYRASLTADFASLWDF